jgi:glyoxylase-like metal-dependent hydrolase (beta-lactamase superfamily II)
VQVSEGIHRLTRGVTNFYLIEESGKYTLVDAGTPGDWAFFSRSLAELGGKLADLDAVLLTHAHSDHTGFAERARAEAGSRVWIHAADEQAARTGKAAGKNDGKVTSYLLRAAFYRTAFSLLRRGASRIIPIAEVSAFADGEQIDVPGRPRAVHAPGHTPGSAAILLEGRRALLTGDVMATENPLTGRLGPQIMPSGLNLDTAQALASLEALRGIDADLLLPGHGDPWTQGVTEAVQKARAAGPS